MKKIIDDQFQDRVQGLVSAGLSRQKTAKHLGVSRPTIRRALAAWATRIGAAMAEAGQAHCVYAPDAIVGPPPPPAGPIVRPRYLPTLAVLA